jgi:hypothetical protein
VLLILDCLAENLLYGIHILHIIFFPHVRINPAEAIRFFGQKEILSMPLGREVKPFAPCRRIVACKRSLNGVEKRRNFSKITGPFSLTLPPFATRSAHVDGDVEASGGESGNV